MMADAFIAAGCRGVVLDERRPGEVRSLSQVRGYLPDPQPGLPGLLRALHRAQARCVNFGLDYSTRHVARRYVQEEDWAEGWKAHFQPTRIGRRLMIVPTWENYAPEPDDLIILLDPGMAFGTGAHATTRLCLEALERLADAGLGPVIDVGTGSGILAIAAALLGARPIHALDNDPITIPIAIENAERNQVGGHIHFSAGELSRLDAIAPLVVANILAETVIDILPDVLQRLAPGGTLLASGIVAEKLETVLSALAGHKFSITDVRRDGDWCLVVATRGP